MPLAGESVRSIYPIQLRKNQDNDRIEPHFSLKLWAYNPSHGQRLGHSLTKAAKD